MKILNLYMIINSESGLWWSDKSGWVKQEGATVYTEGDHREMGDDLPESGKWMKFSRKVLL